MKKRFRRIKNELVGITASNSFIINAMSLTTLTLNIYKMKKVYGLYLLYTSNFSFCTNKLHKVNINSKHLSKPTPTLVNLINQLSDCSNGQNNEYNQNV